MTPEEEDALTQELVRVQIESMREAGIMPPKPKVRFSFTPWPEEKHEINPINPQEFYSIMERAFGGPPWSLDWDAVNHFRGIKACFKKPDPIWDRLIEIMTKEFEKIEIQVRDD